MEKEFLNLQDIKNRVETCKECDLHINRCKSVFSKGNDKAKIMLIGEAPGKEENETGIPFIGLAGTKLDNILTKVGFNTEKDIYFANTVKCRPLNNKVPSKGECKTCKKFLDAQIKFVNPKIIVLCGKIAASNFGFNKAMNMLHGKYYKKDGRIFFIIYHPISSIENKIKINDLIKLKGEVCKKNI